MSDQTKQKNKINDQKGYLYFFLVFLNYFSNFLK